MPEQPHSDTGEFRPAVDPEQLINRGSEETEDPMRDLRAVGPDKPLGYLPDSTILQLGLEPHEVIDQAHRRGLSTFHSGPDGDRGRFVYVYDPKALGDVLSKNSHVLWGMGWSENPDEFVRIVDTEQVSPGTLAYDLVADAYGDYENPMRRSPGKPTSGPDR